jgi:hypothetical protein
MRLSDATCPAVVQAAKVCSYDSPSAFMRAAVEKDLRGADATLDESERYSKQVRRVSIGQQALFAYVDAVAKVILSTLPDLAATQARRFRSLRRLRHCIDSAL